MIEQYCPLCGRVYPITHSYFCDADTTTLLQREPKANPEPQKPVSLTEVTQVQAQHGQTPSTPTPTSAARTTLEERVEVDVLGRTLPLEPGPGILIGREDTATDAVLRDRTAVSRVHCQLQLRDGEVWVTDLESTNGTFVDGRPVAPDVPVVLPRNGSLHLAGGQGVDIVVRWLR